MTEDSKLILDMKKGTKDLSYLNRIVVIDKVDLRSLIEFLQEAEVFINETEVINKLRGIK